VGIYVRGGGRRGLALLAPMLLSAVLVAYAGHETRGPSLRELEARHQLNEGS
jgi:cell division protein FtsL